MGDHLDTRITDAERRLGGQGTGPILLFIDRNDPEAKSADDLAPGKAPGRFISKKEAQRWVAREMPVRPSAYEGEIQIVIVDFTGGTNPTEIAERRRRNDENENQES